MSNNTSEYVSRLAQGVWRIAGSRISLALLQQSEIQNRPLLEKVRSFARASVVQA